MITFWTIPRAFTGEFDAIQRRAITSWLTAVPGSDVVLVGNEHGAAEFGAEMGAVVIPFVAMNKYCTPLVNDAIWRAGQAGKYALTCMISADIVLDDSFAQMIEIICDVTRPFVVGQRIDVARDGTETLHPACGIDYFVYLRGTLGDVPPFAVGRTAYDNWLVWNAIQRGLTVIDATNVIDAYHLVHGYPSWDGGKAEMALGDERAENLRLFKETGCDRVYTIKDTPFVVEYRDGWEVVPRG
jgi:hypothetical protein